MNWTDELDTHLAALTGLVSSGAAGESTDGCPPARWSAGRWLSVWCSTIEHRFDTGP